MEVRDTGSRQRGPESEPAAFQWLGIEIIHDALAIYVETRSPRHRTLNLHMIPVVRSQQMGCIRILF